MYTHIRVCVYVYMCVFWCFRWDGKFDSLIILKQKQKSLTIFIRYFC